MKNHTKYSLGSRRGPHSAVGFKTASCNNACEANKTAMVICNTGTALRNARVGSLLAL